MFGARGINRKQLANEFYFSFARWWSKCIHTNGYVTLTTTGLKLKKKRWRGVTSAHLLSHYGFLLILVYMFGFFFVNQFFLGWWETQIKRQNVYYTKKMFFDILQNFNIPHWRRCIPSPEIEWTGPSDWLQGGMWVYSSPLVNNVVLKGIILSAILRDNPT